MSQQTFFCKQFKDTISKSQQTFFLAAWNKDLTRRAPTPTNLSMKEKWYENEHP